MNERTLVNTVIPEGIPAVVSDLQHKVGIARNAFLQLSSRLDALLGPEQPEKASDLSSEIPQSMAPLEKEIECISREIAIFTASINRIAARLRI